MDKERIIKPGEKGEATLEIVKKSVDLDELSQKEEVKRPFFCECGKPLTDEKEIERCSNPDCDALLCSDCAVRINKRTFCPECAKMKYHSLSKVDYEILLAIKSGMHSESEIATVAGLEEREVKRRIEEMRNPLIRKEESLLGFTNRKSLSPEGKEALEVYGKIFDKDEGVKEFEEELSVARVLRRGWENF